jgi:hypothetical protein
MLALHKSLEFIVIFCNKNFVKTRMLLLLIVNTKNWYRKGTDLWAEFGKEMPFGRKNLLRGFGKDACDRQYAIIR